MVAAGCPEEGSRSGSDHKATMPKLLLTVQEAAEMLSISRAKLYELLAGGVIESVKLEGSRRIPTETLLDYIEELRRVS